MEMSDKSASQDIPEPADSMAAGGNIYSRSYGSTDSMESPARDTSYLIHSGRTTPVENGGYRGSDGGYEELLKDSVPCPSCRGLGRVPKESENELVALIPMRDKRLKPRRTDTYAKANARVFQTQSVQVMNDVFLQSELYIAFPQRDTRQIFRVLYVIVAMVLCLLFAGLCMFFLFPRSVVVSSNRPLLEPLSLKLNTSASFVNFTVMNFYNFTNSNFYPVTILGAHVTAVYDDKVMTTAINRTQIDVPIKSQLTYGIFINFVLSNDNGFGFLVSFCEDSRKWVHNLPISFELLANYTYLGHVEQASLTTYQQVSCYNNSMAVKSRH